jgi:hypothetical protein
MKKLHLIATVLCGLAASAAAQSTVFHYRINEAAAASLPTVPSLGGSAGTAQGTFTGVYSTDIPTEGVPAGAGTRSIVGAFDAASDGVNSAANQELLNNTLIANGGFTYEAWFKPLGVGAINPIFDYAGTEKLMYQNGNIVMRFDSGSGDHTLVTGVPANEWNYIAVVFQHDGNPQVGGSISGTLTWYFNDLIPAGSIPVRKASFGDSLNRRIGVGRHPQGFAGDNYAGLIYEPKVSLGALTAQQLLYDIVPDTNPQLIAADSYVEESSGENLTIAIPLRNQFGTTLPVDISSINIAGSPAFSVASAPGSIAADGGVGEILVDFISPGDGLYEATLTVNSNDPTRPTFSIDLSVDVRDPAIQIDDSLDFGIFFSPAVTTESVTVTNLGGVSTLTLQSAVISGDGASAYSVVGTLPDILPGETSFFDIEFAPQTGGAFPAVLTLTTNDPRNPQVTVNLSGFVQDPEASVPANLNFGVFSPDPGPQTLPLAVSNFGFTQDLLVSSATLGGPAASSYSIDTAVPLNISPAGSGTIDIGFNPGTAAGTFFAWVTLETNDPVNPTITVPLLARVTGTIDLAGPSLLSHWTFDTLADPGIDSGGLGYDGVVRGDAVATSESVVGAGALTLDGNGDHIEIPQGPVRYTAMDDDGDGFTIALWVKSSSGLSLNLRQRYFSKLGTAAGGIGVGQDLDTNLLATTYGVSDYNAVGLMPSQDEWHHIAYVFGGTPTNTVRFYVDGALVGTVNGTSALLDTLAPSYAIGGLGGTALEWFDGQLDDLRVYGVELPVDQIAELAAMASGPAAELKVTAVERTAAGRLRIEFSGAPNTAHVVKSSTDLTVSPFTGSVTPALDGLTTDANGEGFVEIDIPTDPATFYQIQTP